MIISISDMIGLSAGLIVWVCAIVYFLKNPRKRTPTDVVIHNTLGWDISVSKNESKKGLFNRFTATKQFEQGETDAESPPEFSDTGSELVDVSVYTNGRKLSGGTNSSKRIDLDGCSVSRLPKKRSVKRLQESSRESGKSAEKQHEDRDGEYVDSKHSSSVHL